MESIFENHSLSNTLCTKDHASWYAKGVPAAFPFEAPMPQSNKNIHKVTDTVDIPGFSWTHALVCTWHSFLAM